MQGIHNKIFQKLRDTYSNSLKIKEKKYLEIYKFFQNFMSITYYVNMFLCRILFFFFYLLWYWRFWVTVSVPLPSVALVVGDWFIWQLPTLSETIIPEGETLEAWEQTMQTYLNWTTYITMFTSKLMKDKLKHIQNMWICGMMSRPRYPDYTVKCRKLSQIGWYWHNVLSLPLKSK